MRQTARLEIEKRIIEVEAKILFSQTNFSWIESSVFQDFLLSWGSLAEYYDSHFDDSITEVSIEILYLYLRWVRILNKILRFGQTNPYFESAKSALSTLEYWIDEIINTGFGKLNFDDDLDKL